LIYLYDSNDVSLDGPLKLAFSEDVRQRFEACGWQALEVKDGDRDLAAIDAAIAAARAERARPSLIIVRTTIGWGAPTKQGTAEAHGAPLGKAEAAAAKKAFGLDPERSFVVSEEVREHVETLRARARAGRKAWAQRLASHGAVHADLAAPWRRAIAGELVESWDQGLPTFKAGEKIATRAAGGKVLQALSARIPELIGGDADLSSSTRTAVPGGDFHGPTGAGRNLRFGVREHAMGAIANGMACHGGLRPYTATFFCFSDYMRPPMRLAALSHLPVTFVFTHDSIGLGEDGPTHQPVEHLMALRAMPNLWVVRPGDAEETTAAWCCALRRRHGPTAIVLSRQNLPVLDRGRFAPAAGLERGGYILAEAPGGAARAILIASGSELCIAVAAHETLAHNGIPTRVVSMPCWEAFAAQDAAYREKVLPSHLVARVSIEAGATFGWERFVGTHGIAIGVDRFGASAPAEVVYREYGLTPEAVVRAVQSLLQAN